MKALAPEAKTTYGKPNSSLPTIALLTPARQAPKANRAACKRTVVMSTRRTLSCSHIAVRASARLIRHACRDGQCHRVFRWLQVFRPTHRGCVVEFGREVSPCL